MTVYVLSTMTNAISYNGYRYIGNEDSKGAGKLPVIQTKVVIHGGAGVPSARSGFGEMSRDPDGSPIWTATGVITPVSDEKYEMLKDHWLFKKHEESGRVRVLKSDITDNHKAVKKEVSTMNRDDNLAQLTPATLKMKVKAKLVTPELDQDGTFRL